MTTTEPTHAALAYACPFCGAAPHQPCRTHRGRGRVADWPHSRRVALTHEPVQVPAHQALCCVCGNLRTCKEPKNKRGWFGSNPDWHRKLGDLKCSECGRVTTHALLERGDASYRDCDEIMQRVALGSDVPKGWHWDEERLRRQYREGDLPRNPELSHWFNRGEADAARDRGDTHMAALCGDIAPVPRSLRDGLSSTEQVAPERIDWDTEFEDPETGEWWVDMECVNCMYVTNERRRARARQRAEELVLWYVPRLHKLNAAEIEALVGFLEPAANATFARWQDEAAKGNNPA